MYRFITKSSPIIRQTTSRITRQYSTRSSSSATNAFNSKYLVGVLVPTLLAVGYLTQVSSNTSAIQNASVADHIREDFAEGDALAKDAQERLEITQTKLQKEQEAEAIKKDEKEAIEKAEKKETIQQEKKQQQQPESTKKDGHNKSEPKPESSSGSESKSESESESGEPKQEAAFNPDTGEINWDCPCLGGMAHGPCGEEFKEAFSCFVFSETEPKGIDCIKKFENMRSCFKRYPEHYRDELYDDGEDEQQSTEATEHIVLETTEPAVQEIEQGIEEHKVKTQKSTN